MSYELDVIREKVSENETISRDLLYRMEEESEQSGLVARQLEVVKEERDQALEQSRSLQGQLE